MSHKMLSLQQMKINTINVNRQDLHTEDDELRYLKHFPSNKGTIKLFQRFIAYVMSMHVSIIKEE